MSREGAKVKSACQVQEGWSNIEFANAYAANLRSRVRLGPDLILDTQDACRLLEAADYAEREDY